MSSSPLQVRANLSDLYGSTMLPVLEEFFQAEIALHPSRRDELFKIVSTDRDIWQSTELHDMDLFSEIAEGTAYKFARPKQGADKTLVVSKFGLGFSISEEAVEDGKFDNIADAVRKLARSGRESQEINAMNIINNGFSTETTADGRPLFDTAHTLPSGLSFRNELSTAADLSATSLETMLSDFETEFIGDGGQIYDVTPRVLLVHPDNKRLAKELIGSELKATTANDSTGITNVNNMNSFREEGLRVVSSPHLTDTDSWYMLAMPEETGLRIVQRKPLETKAATGDQGFANDAIFYKARYREVIGATHPYGVYGSPGA